MSISETESLKQKIYKFNEWVRDNNVPISEAILSHYEIHGEFVATQRKELGYFPYSCEELALLPADLGNYSMGAYNPCKYAKLKRGDKVLDVGCGVGVDLFLAASKVGKTGMVIGVDVTFSLLRRGSDILVCESPKMESGYACPIIFIQASGDILPIASSKIDVIVSNCCLHLLDKLRAFAEFFRALKPGGRAVLADVVAEDDSIENFHDNPLMYLYSGGGKQTSEQYKSLAKETGFSEVKFIIERQPWDIEGEPMPGGYLLLKK
jgi:ubiquinone/menaquinone biosynthesis C-methylase UbiE